MPKPPADPSPVADFELSLDQLEALVGQMEQGDLTLEDSLAAYERGVGLYRRCQMALESAELRVRLLTDPEQPDAGEPFLPLEGGEPRFAAWTARVEAGLAAALPDPVAAPQRLHRAMRHAVLGGGKRMRPLLVYATGHLLGADEAWLDAPAVAVELVHAYSLVHDDLPAMDDDDLRRGQPTVHVAFDEATAILAGDALQTRAFEVLAASCHPGAGDGPGDAVVGPGAALVVDWFGTLAAASGVRGMCGGQALDIDATGQQQSIAALGRMHEWKTGALIRAAVAMGAAAGGADPALRARLDGFATSLGLAFQVRDDLLDVESTSAVLGKTAGKDAAQSKSTYVTLLGLDATRAKLDALSGEMANALSGFDERAEPLRALARLAVLRDH